MNQHCFFITHVNFSCMSPKFVLTYPQIVENGGIIMVHTIDFEIDIMKKSSLINQNLFQS